MNINNFTSKILIGTANFNQSYGIANNFIPLTEQKIKKIIKVANLNNLKTFDTALGYNNVDKLLGKLTYKNSKYISKISDLDLSNIETSINYQINRSLKNLKKKNLEGLLLHNEKILINKHGKKIFNILQKLKKKKIIKKIGVSFYDKKNLIKTIKNFKLDFVQIPINIFDQRFIDKKTIDILKKKNIEIHARSIFLQGILLKQNKKVKYKFLKWKNIFNKYHKYLKEKKLTPIKACLNFVINKNYIDKVVIGVFSDKQLLEILNNIENLNLNFDEMKQNSKTKLINPNFW